MEQTKEGKEMTDDLVKRLRDRDASPQDTEAAADRIEELEKAFRIFIKEIEDVFACISDATSASGCNYPPAFQTARNVFNEKKHD